jgi:hypothetical protein
MKEQENTFDFNDAVQQLIAGKKISGKDGVLAPLVKQLVEAALEAEVESHITQDVLSGNKNRLKGTGNFKFQTNLKHSAFLPTREKSSTQNLRFYQYFPPPLNEAKNF